MYDTCIKMAIQLMEQGDNEQAINQFNKAIDYDSKNTVGYFYKFQVLFELERYQEAKEVCDKLIKISQNLPDIILAYYYIATTLAALGSLEEAKNYIKDIEKFKDLGSTQMVNQLTANKIDQIFKHSLELYNSIQTKLSTQDFQGNLIVPNKINDNVNLTGKETKDYKSMIIDIDL